MSINNQPHGETGAESQPLADKSTPVAIVLAVLLAPAAYLYVGKTKWAVINLLTANYLLLGFIIAPIHVYTIIGDAGN